MSRSLPFRSVAALGASGLLALTAWSCTFPDYEVEAAPRCDNRIQDLDESDIDCGGRCSPCLTGQACLVPQDCASGVCRADNEDGTISSRVCAAPTCDDFVQNGNETDVDCGEACSNEGRRCRAGKKCNVEEDCESFSCLEGICVEASCTDGITNGDETDEDCGGNDCTPRCDLGQRCEEDEDCESSFCQDEKCVPAFCRNQEIDPGETDEDCGGPACAPCPEGASCLEARDCQSENCDDEVCKAPSCDDGVQNQGETSADCGGDICEGCPPGEPCTDGGDCLEKVCMEAVCSEPTCDDTQQNGSETDLDCGGGCDGCADGLHCERNQDCRSQKCTDETCQPPTCDDGIKNGTESDVDCGVGCPLCVTEDACVSVDDCASQRCDEECLPLRLLTACRRANQGDVDSLQLDFRLQNTSERAIPLSDFSIRYYYSKEPSGEESVTVYYVTGGEVTSTFSNVSLGDSATRVMEFRFRGDGNVAPGGTAQLQVDVRASGALFKQSNDFSFTAQTDYTESTKTLLYRSGRRVFGTEPPTP